MPESPHDPVIALRHAVVLLGRFPALAGADLTVNRGEVVLISGPNGAGKTTLLRLCAGLSRLDDGTAHILGHDVMTDRRAVRRDVGYLGHASGLYDDLTVADNVVFWAQAAGASKTDATAAMHRLQLDGRLSDVPVALLSAGQRRRTGLAILLAQRPRLWLLDEPHAALDMAARDTLDQIIRQAAAGGAAVMIASHDHERTGALAHRALTLAGGHFVNADRVVANG